MVEHVATSPLQRALDVIEELPREDQVTLVEVMQRRLAEWRRAEIARNAETTLEAVREGRAQYGTVDDLRRDLLGDSCDD
jgi:hypothetical protein